jgi:hypothetical protein
MDKRRRNHKCPTARYYNRESAEARRLTRRAARRAVRAWLRAADFDTAPAPLPARTEGHLSW